MNPVKIVQLTIENVKRISAVEITPKGSVIEITGRNAQGKSTVIDSIAYALGGQSLCPETPIRKGSTKATVSVKLDNGLLVRRTWTKGGTYLTVTNQDGSPVSSPQQILDKLASHISFDPLEFARMKAKDQCQILLDLLGISKDLDKLSRERDTVFGNRTAWGRERDRLAAIVNTSAGELVGDIPDEPTSFAEVSMELEAALKQQADNKSERDSLQHHRESLAKKEEERDNLRRRLANLQRELDQLNRQCGELDGTIVKYTEAVAEKAKAVATALEPDVDAIRKRLGKIESVNELVRKKKQFAKDSEERNEAAQQYDRHTAKIEELDERRRKVLADAKYPVDGLGYDGGSVTYKGVPFSEASQAEKILVSMSIGMASHPSLRVLMSKDGSLLDDESLAALYQAVTSEDYQLLIERVCNDPSNANPAAVVIEDGRVLPHGKKGKEI